MSECAEDNLITALISLDINKDITGPVKLNVKDSEASEGNDLSTPFGVIIYDDEDEDNDDVDIDSNNLVPRGPIKQSNNQRPVPYIAKKKSGYDGGHLDLNLPILQQSVCLTPPLSGQFSPSKQTVNFNDSPESAFSPESIISSDETLFDLYSIIKDDDSGTFSSISKQSSESDLFDGIETPPGIEDPEVVQFLIDKVENIPIEKFCKIEDTTDSSQNRPTKNIDEQIGACIAVAKMDVKDIMKIDLDGDNCLIVAAAKDKIYLVKALAERLEREGYLHNAINHINNNGITALYCAVMNNNRALVGYLIAKNANVNLSYFTKPRDRNNSLIFRLIHCVCERGLEYVATLKQLLSVTNLEIDCYNNKGCTPLLCAIEKHNLRVVDSRLTIILLVQHGANLMKENSQSYKPPLQIAIEKKSPELVILLLSLAIEIDRLNSTTIKQPLNHFQNKQEPTKYTNIKEEFLDDFTDNYQNLDQLIQPLEGSMYANGYGNPIDVVVKNGCCNFVDQRNANSAYAPFDLQGGSAFNFRTGVDVTAQNVNFQPCMNLPYQNNAAFQPGADLSTPRYVESRAGVYSQCNGFNYRSDRQQATMPPVDYGHDVYPVVDQADQNRFLPTQIQQYNRTTADCAKPAGVRGSASKDESLIGRMLNFRNKGQSDFSMLGCAYDVCAACGADDRPKEVVKILLFYGATVVPKSRANPISNLPEFAIYQKKKK